LVARALQDASGLIEYSIDGTVVKVGDNHIMRLRIRHRAGQQVLVTITRPATEIEEMLQDAATAILRIIDPQVLCALRLREGLAATPRNIEEAETCVNVTLASAALTDKIWLYNLQGVIAFMHSDYAGATAAFREALRLDPDFSPAQLNLAILLAHNGRHEEAIRAYQAVFRRASRGESPQTYAATYAEWGNSLMALGRPAEARQRYAEAVRSDPHYALAYFFWADALPAGREADELRRLGTLAQQASSQIYTENLVGLIRETQVVSPPN
jgi:tetratricopeptide (TPR) repeat protein